MQEIIAYAAVYVAEASITGVYLDYLFDKKRKRCLHLLSFALTYGILFGISTKKCHTKINRGRNKLR